MTPEDIIAAMQEHFKDRMNEKIDMYDFGDAIAIQNPDNKEEFCSIMKEFGL